MRVLSGGEARTIRVCSDAGGGGCSSSNSARARSSHEIRRAASELARSVPVAVDQDRRHRRHHHHYQQLCDGACFTSAAWALHLTPPDTSITYYDNHQLILLSKLNQICYSSYCCCCYSCYLILLILQLSYRDSGSCNHAQSKDAKNW